MEQVIEFFNTPIGQAVGALLLALSYKGVHYLGAKYKLPMEHVDILWDLLQEKKDQPKTKEAVKDVALEAIRLIKKKNRR
jgi:hypothetical protein